MLSVAGRRPAVLVHKKSRRIIAANPAAAREYGYPSETLAGRPIESLWPQAPSNLDRASFGVLKIARHRLSDGRPMDVGVVVLPTAQARGAVGLAVSKVSKRAFSLALLESQGRVLELMSRAAPLEKVLRALVLAIEDLSADMLGSVLLLADDAVHAKPGAAPSLPPGYCEAIDGLKIGPAAGSCGTAMYHGRQVIVTDINVDPRWARYRKLAQRYGLRACWSTPIVSRGGKVLGSFALYYREPRAPSQQEKELVQVAAELAALAVERSKAGAPDLPAGAQEELSRRELQVLRSIAHGQPVKRIAAHLGLAISTVYTHRARIFRKVGVGSDVALARYALVHRMVE